MPYALLLEGRLAPPHWQSEAVVAHIVRSCIGPRQFFQRQALPIPPAIVKKPWFLREVRCSRVVLSFMHDVDGEDPRLQAKLVQRLEREWLVDDGDSILRKRSQRLIGLVPSDERIAQFRRLSNRQRRRVSLAVLRTLFDAWPTTRRFQQDGFVCLFGCPAELADDDLRHYIVCPRLRAIVSAATRAPPLAPDLVDVLYPNSQYSFWQAAVFSMLYQAVRRDQHLGSQIARLLHARRVGDIFRTLRVEAVSIAYDFGGVNFVKATAGQDP